MKKLILLLLCSLIVATNIGAQTVFAPLNSKWNYLSTKDFGDESKLYKKYETLKDTMYFGHLCSKIIGRSIKVSASGSIIDTTQEKPLFTYVNSDTVFYYNDNFNRFYPLYIFDVKVGDTVSYHVPYMVIGKTDTIFSVRIDSIKNVLINGYSARAIYSTRVGGGMFGLSTLIERLGTIISNYNYPILGYYDYIGPSSGAELRCYRDGLLDTNLNDKSFDCDSLNLTSINLFNQLGDIHIRPNPVQNILSIDIPNKFAQRLHYCLIDALGNKCNLSPQEYGTQVLIDLTAYPSGLYFIRIYSNDQKNLNKFYKIIKN